MRPYRGMTKEGKWVYGYYAKQCYCIGSSGPDIVQDIIIELGSLVPHIVILSTVGQSIGRKDKNGVEIYVGDFDKDRIVITWNQDDCSFIGDHPDEAHCLYNTEKWFEIIGNIHENPELLKD